MSRKPESSVDQPQGEARLGYTLVCDDVRLEAGNKMSLMGLFRNIVLPGLPASVIRFAILNHWEGEGAFESDIRVLGPGGAELLRSKPSRFSIQAGGFADNVTFFTNVTFREEGVHTIQIALSGRVVSELPVAVHVQQAPPKGTVN
jgi:hypothetical protein